MTKSLQVINRIRLRDLPADEASTYLKRFVQGEEKVRWSSEDIKEINTFQENIIVILKRAPDNYTFFLAETVLNMIYTQLVSDKRGDYVRDLMGSDLFSELLNGWTERKSDIIESLNEREIMFFAFLLKFDNLEVLRLQPLFEKIGRGLLSFVRKADPAATDKKKTDAIKRLFMAFNEDVRDLYLKNLKHQDLSDFHRYYEAQVDFFGNFSSTKRWTDETTGISELMRRIGA